MRLEGKVALITGGGNGMGAEECRLFSREGAKIVIADVRDEDGRQVEAQIAEAGGDGLFVHLDVTEEVSWNAAVREAVSRFGKLDVLVNNAGISGSGEKNFASIEAWDRLMSINARGGVPRHHPCDSGDDQGRRWIYRQHFFYLGVCWARICPSRL